MNRLLSFGGSTALHAAAAGALLLAAGSGLLSEPPRASVAATPAVPMSFDVRRDAPLPVLFETPTLPDALPLAETDLEFEPETVVEDVDLVPPPVTKGSGRFVPRPMRTTAQLPTSLAADPAPEVEAETAPVEIHNPPPAYPRAASRRGLEGHVLIEVRILRDGTVADPAVLECEGSSSFAEAALAAVKAWRYQPASIGGRPVERLHRIRFTFRLR